MSERTLGKAVATFAGVAMGMREQGYTELGPMLDELRAVLLRWHPSAVFDAEQTVRTINGGGPAGRAITAGAAALLDEAASVAAAAADGPAVSIADVIQLEPRGPWGPVFCIVEAVRSWGVECSFFVPQLRDTPPAVAPMRAEWGTFTRIGPAAYVDSSTLRKDG